MSVVISENVTKSYQAGDVTVQALRGLTFRIEAGSFVSFVGPSGSGKSTLLNLIGCLDRPTSGTLTVLDTDVGALGRKESARFRGQNIGFIFQDFNLIPVLSVYENVEYPLIMVQSWPERRRRDRVMELLAAVGMADQAQKRPDQISGGQKQRVAVARALAPETELVLADEPTANLDSHTGAAIIALMRDMQRELHVSFVFSSHDPKVMAEADDAVMIRDGRIEDIVRRPLTAEATA